MCEGDEYYMWGSTYGARVVGMDARPPPALGHARHFRGVVCAAAMSLTVAEFKDEDGFPTRIAERQHMFAHAVAGEIRRAFPIDGVGH